VSSLGGEDRDVIGLARIGDDACGLILEVREGRMLGKEHHLLGNVEAVDEGAILSLFLTRYYLRGDRFPPEVLLPFDFEDRPLIEELVRERAGRAVHLLVPARGEKVRQVRLANRNASLLLEERLLRDDQETRRASDDVLELQAELGLSRIPRRIACIDISTIQGRDSVGSVVTFENGSPRKAGYRRFRIKYVEGQDDFAMMAEVTERYFRGLLDHGEDPPDLLVIDGGKGQLGAARAVLAELGALDDVDTLALAKRGPSSWCSTSATRPTASRSRTTARCAPSGRSPRSWTRFPGSGPGAAPRCCIISVPSIVFGRLRSRRSPGCRASRRRSRNGSRKRSAHRR
jgi:excinuclease ABC subunit C